MHVPPDLYSAGDQTQGLLHARQALTNRAACTAVSSLPMILWVNWLYLTISLGSWSQTLLNSTERSAGQNTHGDVTQKTNNWC